MSPFRTAARVTLGVTLAACAGDLPTAFDPIPEPLVFVSAGVLHTCGTTASGAVFCWGWNQYGQVGDGTRRDRPLAVLARAPAPLAALSAGGGHSCALATGGAAYCWGLNLSGQLGDDSQTDRAVPGVVAGGLTFGSLDAGGAFTCGVAADSSAYCWGWNIYGQLGDGTRTDRARPMLAVGGRKVSAIAAGAQHSCAVATDSTAYCWGRNDVGQLGDGSTADTTRPVSVTGGLKFTAITVGFYHSCGLTAAGAAYCWGDNAYGQLGDTTARGGASAPRAVGGALAFTALAAGGTHTCGIAAPSRSAYCWGNGASGQLGGLTSGVCATGGIVLPCARAPVAVDGGLSFASLTAGQHHTCGVTTGGVAYCWGLNNFGQLGDGTTRSRHAPQRVANQEGVP